MTTAHARVPQRQRVVLLPPPSVNQLWRIGVERGTGKPKPFMSAAARRWKRGHATMLSTLKVIPEPQQVRLDIVWHMQPDDRGDLDNRLKLLLDSLQGCAYANDRQVAELHVKRLPNQRTSRMEVTIEAL